MEKIFVFSKELLFSPSQYCEKEVYDACKSGHL